MLVLVLTAAMVTTHAAPSVRTPDTPAGRALIGFVDSFNAGGKTRQKWLASRTTIQDEPRANHLRMDAQMLQKLGALSVVRIVSASEASVVAVVRHGHANLHGHLTLEIEPTAPHRVVSIGWRAAKPEEVKEGSGSQTRAGIQRVAHV